MIVLQLAVLTLVAVAGTAVALTREPAAQAIGVSFLGLTLAIMFMVFQAPDVALSQLVIGAVALPLMVLLALARTRAADLQQKARSGRQPKESNPRSAPDHEAASAAAPDEHGGRP